MLDGPAVCTMYEREAAETGRNTARSQTMERFCWGLLNIATNSDCALELAVTIVLDTIISTGHSLVRDKNT